MGPQNTMGLLLVRALGKGGLLRRKPFGRKAFLAEKRYIHRQEPTGTEEIRVAGWVQYTKWTIKYGQKADSHEY